MKARLPRNGEFLASPAFAVMAANAEKKWWLCIVLVGASYGQKKLSEYTK